MSTTLKPADRRSKLSKTERALIAQVRQIVHPTTAFQRQLVVYLKDQLTLKRLRELAGIEGGTR